METRERDLMTNPEKPAAATAVRPPEDAGARALSDALSSSFRIVKVLMLFLVVLFVASGVFTVEPNQNAIVLRFGRPMGDGDDQLLKPGLHWAFPYPIDEVVRLPVGESHTARSTAGWFAISDAEAAAGVTPQALPYLRPGVDGYTLTGDGNIIHVRATVKYRITDPVAYAFRFVSATNTLESILDNAIFYASSRFTADQALYEDKIAFKESVIGRVLEKIDELDLGIALEPSDVVAEAPLDVRASFDEVLATQQERGRKISEAQGYLEEVRSKAEGEAKARISAGMSSSNRLVQAVAAEARYFEEVLPKFERDPELFVSRLLTETVGRVLTNAQDVMFVPARTDGRPRELRLELSREPLAPGGDKNSED